MPLKKELDYLKEAKKLAKQKKLDIKNHILKENATILFENKLIKNS